MVVLDHGSPLAQDMPVFIVAESATTAAKVAVPVEVISVYSASSGCPALILVQVALLLL